MSAPPDIPTIVDADRVQSYSIASSTLTLDLTYPLFGNADDLEVWKDGAKMTSGWTLSSISGTPLADIPLPIEDGRLTFDPPLVNCEIQIRYSWQAHTITDNTAAGVNRREFNLATASQVAGLRERRWMDELLRSEIATERARIDAITPSASVISTFTAAGSGAVARSASSKLGDIVSVKDFGAVGDGVTSDQTAIVNAVADANTNGHLLYWPAGTYLTTASIPYLHDVQHIGPGAIKRGSDTFYVEPTASQTNTLYVDPSSGTLGHDGLSSSQPMRRISETLDAFRNHGPFLNGTWEVQLAAGTYSGTGQETLSLDGVLSLNRIKFKGPNVGHPNVPTAIVDGGSGSTYFMQMQNGSRAEFHDVKIQNFPSSFALNAVFGSSIYTYNAHTYNCLYGLRYTFDSYLRVEGGIIDGNSISGSYGILGVVTCRHQIGVTGGSPTSIGPEIKNCRYGVFAAEGTDGHLNAYIYDCEYGARADDFARFNLDTSDFRRNTVCAIYASGSAGLTGLSTVALNQNGANKNTRDVLLFNGGYELSLNTGRKTVWQEFARPLTAPASGTSENKLQGWELFPKELAPYYFNQHPSARITLQGGKSGTGGTLTLKAYLHTSDAIGGTEIASVVTGSVAGSFVWNLHHIFNGATPDERGSNWLVMNGQTPIVGFQSDSADLDDGNDWWLIITAQLSSGSDSLSGLVLTIDMAR